MKNHPIFSVTPASSYLSKIEIKNIYWQPERHNLAKNLGRYPARGTCTNFTVQMVSEI